MINHTKLHKLRNDVGEDIINELIKHFINEVSQQLIQLQSYTVDIDYNQKQINDVLHILKNTTSLYGADSLFYITNANYEKGVVSEAELLEICKEISCSLESFEMLVQRG
ncbi:hypothetical protein [Pseudoalteromonas sp.]|uniref:hypothetical protein n=1 Tax=Pseudoalteromonas sp. TaxID=53249 RepID=UPI001BCB6DFA|nr:hypothetical protein [Pseudoalteromonas sp.]